MKFQPRSVAAVVLAAVLSIQVAPIAVAAPRDRDDFSAKIIRIIQKLQRFVGISTLDETLNPPRP